LSLETFARAISCLAPGEEVAARDHLNDTLHAHNGIGLPHSVARSVDNKALVGKGPRDWSVWADRWEARDADRLAAWVAAELRQPHQTPEVDK
jgi:hypothetical protein